MESKVEGFTEGQSARALRAAAEWQRFQAELSEEIASQSAAAAALEYDHACRLAAEFPHVFDPPSLGEVGEQDGEFEAEPSDELVVDPFADDVHAIIDAVAQRPSSGVLPDDLPAGLLETRRQFEDEWHRLTDPNTIIPGLMQQPTVRFIDSEPDVVPFSNVRLQSTVKPKYKQGFFVEPAATKGVAGKPIGTRVDHLGHFSRLGNIRGDIGTGGMRAVATHRLFPKFFTATGSGAGEVSISGKLHIYVELECEGARTSSFLARRPEARLPDAAFLKAISTLAYMEFDLTSPTPKMTSTHGVVPLWDARADWFSFANEISAKVEDHTSGARDGWLHIDTGQTTEIKFGSAGASARYLHIGLADTMFTSNTAQMVSYMDMRNLYRVKQVVIQVVS